jgi:hypothetical protein
VRGNPHALFGKRPTEKDPNHGHLAGGRLHSTGGDWKRSTPATDTKKNNPDGKLPGLNGFVAYRQELPPRQSSTLHLK